MLAKKTDSLSKLFFHTGFFFIILLVITLILSSVVFAFKGVMGSWQFPVSIILSYIISYYYTYQDNNEIPVKLYLFIGLPFIILVTALLIASYFYDISYDGQAYHQEALIQLKNRWNPYWQYLPIKVNQAIWVNHYAKGMETVQAAIYCSFGHIEAGKSTNIMLWLGSFFIALSYLINSGWVSLKKSILISLLLATSPVVFNQLLTFYVDGPLASMLLYLFVTCLLIIRNPSNKYLVLLGGMIILLINIKFTGIFYLGLFIGGILLWLLYHKKTVIITKIWWSSVAAGILALGIGFNPYITNTVNFGNPLYPLMGANKVDIIHELNLPAGFPEKSGAERFFFSIFSHTDNIYPWTDHTPQLKLPFTLNRIELVTAPQFDTRIGGFGPMFSGVLILSIILFIFLCLTERNKPFFRNLGYLTVLVIISIVVFPQSWWARYIPQFWFLPIAWLLATEFLTVKRFRLLKNLTYLALVVNLGFCFGGILINLTLTQKINYELDILESSNQTIQVNWGASAANRVRFWDRKIIYDAIDMSHDVEYEYFAGSEAILVNIPPDMNTKIKKPLWLRYTEKWLPLRWSYYGR